MGLRLVDAKLQHFKYGTQEHEYEIIEIDNNWRRIELLLNPSKWHQFYSDGNWAYGPGDPDFRMIGSLIVEFGRCDEYRSGPGEGIVLIKDIHWKAS
jgi:hypothetical protein